MEAKNRLREEHYRLEKHYKGVLECQRREMRVNMLQSIFELGEDTIVDRISVFIT